MLTSPPLSRRRNNRRQKYIKQNKQFTCDTTPPSAVCLLCRKIRFPNMPRMFQTTLNNLNFTTELPLLHQLHFTSIDRIIYCNKVANRQCFYRLSQRVVKLQCQQIIYAQKFFLYLLYSS